MNKSTQAYNCKPCSQNCEQFKVTRSQSVEKSSGLWGRADDWGHVIKGFECHAEEFRARKKSYKICSTKTAFVVDYNIWNFLFPPSLIAIFSAPLPLASVMWFALVNGVECEQTCPILPSSGKKLLEALKVSVRLFVPVPLPWRESASLAWVLEWKESWNRIQLL